MGSPVTCILLCGGRCGFLPVEKGQDGSDLAEGSGGIVHASGSRTGPGFWCSEIPPDTEERAYAFASSLVRELERIGMREDKVGIGEIVDKPEDILQKL